MPLKTCLGCALEKDTAEFYLDATTGRPMARCKPCHRAQVLAAQQRRRADPLARAAEDARRRERARLRREELSARGVRRESTPYVRAWRERHREEFRRQDALYKRLMRPGPWRDGWLRVLAHYGPGCLACGSLEAVAPDHVVPVAQGGDNWAGNLQPLCRRCTQAKRGQRTDHRPDRGAAFAAAPRWESLGRGRKPRLAEDGGQGAA